MEIDGDYEQFILPEEHGSSPVEDNSRFKRLKKRVIPSIDSESNPKSPDLVESDVKGYESDNLDPLFGEKDRIGAKRVLDFGDEFDENRDPGSDLFDETTEGNKKKRRRGKSDGEKKEKKKKGEKGVNSDGKISKEKQREIRKTYLTELTEYQRQMRERKNVAFKPVPVVHKPVSSILEKIRQRKMEVSKKKATVLSYDQQKDPLREIILDVDSEDVSIVERLDVRPDLSISGNPDAQPAAMEATLDVSPVDRSTEDAPCTSNKLNSDKMPLIEETTQSFRPPVSDTQDLFSDSQTSNSQDGTSKEDASSPIEDVAPSLPSMKLMLDSAPLDDMSSDDEDSDKENQIPDLLKQFTENSSPKGDPVKQFVDEEAEEDDSDNDALRFQDEEDDDNMDPEEFNDLITSSYKEKPIDSKRRNELHQMWLQQQDEDGTENLLQRLKSSSKQGKTTLLEDVDEEGSENEEKVSDGEETEHPSPASVPCVNIRKLRQMIPLMFTDKDDGYVSSDDEETERRLSKHQLLEKSEPEGRSTSFSPVEDKRPSKVFGSLKKLNVVPEPKKKPKTASFFNTLLTKGTGKNSTKPSFLHRAPSHPVSSSHRHGSSTMRSFIFGRDDSNSRSSISISEDLSDVVQKESQPKRIAPAKFSSSQAKRSTQSTDVRAETISGASLFEILRQSSRQSSHFTRDNVDHQAVFAAFKSVKKSVKIEGRSQSKNA